MYYNSNSNDYYNSYKKELAELEAYKKGEDSQKIIKFILYLLIIFLFIVTVFYLYKYFNPVIDTRNSFIQQEEVLFKSKPLPNIVIREEELPKSIQLLESTQTTQNTTTRNTSLEKKKKVVSNMSEDDIALIVKIIMSQMNIKAEKPLEEQLQEVSEKKFANKDLEKTNHYNKIILTKNEVKNIQNSSLMELNNNLKGIMSEVIPVESNYTQELNKEFLARKNEMRIIIVQKGDTLSKISKKAYGHDSDYNKIFSANPEMIKNPNQIFIGQRLRIPAYEN